jgi:tetratricopeptide (TPR) repeat protein
LLDVVNRAGIELREKCGLAQITERQAAEVRASSPSNPEATRLYAEGLGKLRIFDTRGAIVLLEKASAGDPYFALVHSSLAEAWSKLGYGQRAIREASKAVDLSTNLSREEQLSIQGQYRAATKEWNKAVEIYGELFSLFPDDIDYGLSLANSQTNDGKSQDAITTLDALRKLPPPVGDDPRIDLAEAFAADTLGDYQRELKAARVAVNKGNASGSRFVVARALRTEGVALRARGENKAAMAILEQATDLFAALGDRGGKPLIMIGNISAEQGDFDKAISVYEAALRSARETGDRATECFALTNIAHVHLDRGDLAGAKPLYVEALGIQQEIEDKRNEGSALSNLGHLLYELGNYSEASKTLNESLSIAREVGNRRSEAYVLSFLGELLYAQGNLDESKKRSEEALETARAIGHKRVVQSSLLGMGSVLLAEGNFEEAQKAQEDGIAIAKEIGEKGSAAQGRLALAQISLEKGLATEAEALAREPVDEFRAEKALGKEATAQALLVRSLLAQGKVSSAERTLEAADVAAEHTQNHLVRFDVDLAGALVHAASHRTAEAETNLRGMMTRAETIGCVPCDFEARLALGQIEVGSGKTTTGLSALEKLKKDASDKGFRLIAQKADAVRK